MPDNNIKANITVNMKSNVNEEADRAAESIDNLTDSMNRMANDIPTVNAAEFFSSQFESTMSGFAASFDSVGASAIDAGDKIDEAFEDSLGSGINLFEMSEDEIAGLNQQMKETGEQSSSSGKILGKLGEITGITGGQIAAMGAKLLTVGAVIKGVKAGFDAFDETLHEVADGAVKAGQTIGDGFNAAINAVGTMIELLDEAGKKVKELADDGVELNKKYFVLSRTLGTDNARSANGVLGKIASLYGMDADNLIDGFNNIERVLSKMGVSADEASEAFTNMALNLSAASGEDFTSITDALQSAITMGRVGKNSSLARILFASDKEINEFKQLNSEVERAEYLFKRAGRANGAMAAYMNTAAGKVEQMNQKFSILNGNLQRLAVGIMAKLSPVIIAVTNLVNRLIVALANLFNIDMEGFDQNFEALSYDSGGLSDDLGKVSDSMDDVSDSANKAKKNLASFDDVIQLNDNSGISDAGKWADELDELSGLDKLFDLSGFNLDLKQSNKELSKFERHLENIADLIEKGKFYEAGKELNLALREVLEGIDWEKIKGKAADLGTNFGLFTNGLFDDKQLGYDIGQTLIEAINTAFTFLYNYLKTTDFTKIGSFFGQSIIGFFENMDSDTIGKTIAETFNKAVDFVKGFVDDMFEHKVFKDVPSHIDTGWELVGYKVSDIINKAFADLDAEEAAETLIRFIDGVFDSLAAFMENLNTKEIKEKFRKFIRKVFDGFKQNAAEWGKTLGEFVQLIIDGIEILIEEYDTSGMREAIMTFLKNSKISDLVSEIMKLKFKIWAEKLIIEIGMFVPKLLSFIGECFVTVLAFLGGLLVNLAAFIIGWAAGLGVKLGNWLKGILSSLWNLIKNGISIIVDGIKAFFGIIIGSVLGLGSQIKDAIGNLLSAAKEKVSAGLNAIKEFFSPSKWLQIGKDALQALWDGLKSIWNGIAGWLNGLKLPSFSLPDWLGGGKVGGWQLFHIPKLANGGIVRQSTIANIGEAGKEAVIPLENNTGWMDTFANKIAGQINNGAGTSGNPVVIDMSKATKQVYTRSEMLAFGREIAESLKLAGFVVSVR